MIKRKIDSWLEHFFTNNKKALLITGARQIGKTFSIRRFGREHFKQFVEINFIENPNLIKIFSKATDRQDLLLRLSTITKQKLIPRDTLIFFDEVQECPDIITAIKFLVEEGSYRYVMSGSLLGVEIKDLRSAPVGYMTVKEMFPIDFEEFASAIGINREIIDKLEEHFNTVSVVDEFIHTKMMEIFRLYLIVGGMPSVVEKYLETNNLQEVMTEQQSIVRLYKQDITKYDPNHKLYIEEIFDRIPAENLPFQLFVSGLGKVSVNHVYYEMIGPRRLYSKTARMAYALKPNHSPFNVIEHISIGFCRAKIQISTKIKGRNRTSLFYSLPRIATFQLKARESMGLVAESEADGLCHRKIRLIF